MCLCENGFQIIFVKYCVWYKTHLEANLILKNVCRKKSWRRLQRNVENRQKEKLQMPEKRKYSPSVKCLPARRQMLEKIAFVETCDFETKKSS